MGSHLSTYPGPRQRALLPHMSLPAAQVDQEVIQPGDRLGNVLHRCRVAGPDKALAARAKGVSRNDSHLLFHEESLTELLTA